MYEPFDSSLSSVMRGLLDLLDLSADEEGAEILHLTNAMVIWAKGGKVNGWWPIKYALLARGFYLGVLETLEDEDVLAGEKALVEWTEYVWNMAELKPALAFFRKVVLTLQEA